MRANRDVESSLVPLLLLLADVMFDFSERSLISQLISRPIMTVPHSSRARDLLIGPTRAERDGSLHISGYRRGCWGRDTRGTMCRARAAGDADAVCAFQNTHKVARSRIETRARSRVRSRRHASTASMMRRVGRRLRAARGPDCRAIHWEPTVPSARENPREPIRG